jgi:hypothetical protein
MKTISKISCLYDHVSISSTHNKEAASVFNESASACLKAILTGKGVRFSLYVEDSFGVVFVNWRFTKTCYFCKLDA